MKCVSRKILQPLFKSEILMGIVRGGDAEYEESEPSFEEKTAKWAETLQSHLAEDPGALKLSGKYISNEDVTIICNYQGMEKVRILDLADNQISDDALPVLFESENLAQIEELYLGINFLIGQGLVDIAQSSQIKLKNLKTLVISDNRLTDASVAELLRSENFPNLESLDVGWNEVGNETAKTLGETSTFPGLKKLEMERGYIDVEALKEMMQGSLMDQLQELDISANKLKDEGVKVLASAPKWKALKQFRLSQNMFGDEGAKALGESASLAGLTHLYIGRNYFGNEGAQAIYESKTLTALKTLVLKEGVEEDPGLVNYSRPELLRPDDPNSI
jgi:Ran GTPase-activating protein (RanGAP) involved in mRNA processing and transport